METILLPLRISGVLAFLGAFLYAIGDVLLLASKVNLDEYPKLKPFVKLLSDAEKMIVLSPNRMIWVRCLAFLQLRYMSWVTGTSTKAWAA
ncbi:MAG: hypothetical protein U0X93_03995 [Anaerolineales bacterium]